MTFADAEYADTRKQTRKKLALTEMDRVVSWKGLIAMIEPHYPTGEGGGVRLSVDGDAAGSSHAEQVGLQRSGDGRGAVRDDFPAPVFRIEPAVDPG